MRNIPVPIAWIYRLFLILALAVLLGCAGTPDVVRHGFSFINDSPDAELLDYRYGTSFYGRSEREKFGRVKQGFGVFGEIRRGDDLYVKWKLKSTGEIFEDTVDLQTRLPRDIKDCQVYFLVRSSQLYVYLITPQKRAKNELRNGPDEWSFRHTVTLYPDQPKP